MTYKLEVMMRPVTDVARALAFYAEQAGVTLDVDHNPTADFRVAQLTPPGSSCAVQIGMGLTDAAPTPCAAYTSSLKTFKRCETS